MAKILDMGGGVAKTTSGLPCIYFLGYATLYAEEVVPYVRAHATPGARR